MITAYWHWAFYALAGSAVGVLFFLGIRSMDREERSNDAPREGMLGPYLAGMEFPAEEDDGHSRKLVVDVELPPGTFDPQPAGKVRYAPEYAGRPVMLTDGSPVTADHRDLLPNGMQKGYVVLSAEERAKGFVRPVRTSYVHVGAPPGEAMTPAGCGAETTMGLALAETYARRPDFYSGTFCATCRKHFPVGSDGEFVWSGTDERVGT